jgi:arylsulfatase A-like enzyme
MNVIMVMYDSLNRRLLPPYGCDWVHAPNFRRLAERTVTFDTSYICSMPCMPARRELHTARPNFLHRGWGPLEPFDDSVPAMLKNRGVNTHLVTDHYHYFEEGGATYHTKYSTWEAFRGQEGDPWIGHVGEVAVPDQICAHDGAWGKQDVVNRRHIAREELQPQSRTFAAGIDFIRRNRAAGDWFLQIETFDPHEPFFSDRKYKDLYAGHYDRYKGKPFDWPHYREVMETTEEVEHCRHEYAALVSMCDANLGLVLGAMDDLDLWKDTMLIVWTDHGFLLGEHDCWAKLWTPWYQELAHTPFFVWDPRCGKRGERRQALVQPAIDLGPTILECFGVERTPDMLGKPLRETIATDASVRDAGLFGAFGGAVNVTDGRYVYMHPPSSPSNAPLYEYTLMPTRMRQPFSVSEVKTMEKSAPFTFTKGCSVMRFDGHNPWASSPRNLRKQLWDVREDPLQMAPLSDAKVESRMVAHMVRLMKECDAPVEQFERLGLTRAN